MKLIPLSQGMFAQVDDADFEWLNQWKWFYDENGFAGRNVSVGYKKQIRIYMHRFILNTPKNMLTDHRDLDGLNNQRYNIRICTNSQNGMNREKQKGSHTSKFKGVCLPSGRLKWTSNIVLENKSIFLGCFKSEEEAAMAYNNKATELFGEFARLNEV